MEQYASPYLGMGSNPISMIDSTGGEAFAEKNGTAVGQVHTDSDWSWKWDGSSWGGLNGLPDVLSSVNIANSYQNSFFQNI